MLRKIEQLVALILLIDSVDVFEEFYSLFFSFLSKRVMLSKNRLKLVSQISFSLYVKTVDSDFAKGRGSE